MKWNLGLLLAAVVSLCVSCLEPGTTSTRGKAIRTTDGADATAQPGTRQDPFSPGDISLTKIYQPINPAPGAPLTFSGDTYSIRNQDGTVIRFSQTEFSEAYATEATMPEAAAITDPDEGWSLWENGLIRILDGVQTRFRIPAFDRSSAGHRLLYCDKEFAIVAGKRFHILNTSTMELTSTSLPGDLNGSGPMSAGPLRDGSGFYLWTPGTVTIYRPDSATRESIAFDPVLPAGVSPQAMALSIGIDTSGAVIISGDFIALTDQAIYSSSTDATVWEPEGQPDDSTSGEDPPEDKPGDMPDDMPGDMPDDNTMPPDDPAPEPPEVASYEQVLKKMVDDNCVKCHPGVSKDLSTYDLFFQSADGSEARINLPVTNGGVMPPSYFQMNVTREDLIKAFNDWKEGGYQQ